ncbi:class I SAM-dependent methyltransferase [Rathayibacter toxicus]|nr:class I SAM-dependent methyltransferase [Rathayibacter toxicus]
MDRRIMTQEVSQAYSKRASEYVAHLGSVKDMDPLDVALITSWGTSVVGPVLDAGSGPGHWTQLLCEHGCDARGIDMVQKFVGSARERFPRASFEVGDLLAMPFDKASFDGVLAWYSLIHLRPELRSQAFGEFARVLRPAGTLLVGAFLGTQGAPFAHAITEAFYWSEQGLVSDLEAAGFTVISVHTRSSEGNRPHLAVIAQRL